MSEKILYRGAVLIDGTGNPPLKDAAVLVHGKEIVQLGRVEEMEGVIAESEYKTIDLQGKTIIPGLINTHVHILLEPVGNTFEILQQESRTRTAVRGMLNLRKQLNSGIIALRDLGAPDGIDIELRKCLQEGLIQGPEIKVCGKVITMTGGQAYTMGRECDGSDEARKAAREQLKAGADFIKLMATGGVMTQGSEPGTAQLTKEEMKAAVEEAHKAGKKAAAHIQGRTGALNALIAGVDTVEHGVFLDDEIIELMLKNDVYLVPTLSAPYWIIKYGVENGIPQFAVDKTKRITEKHLESVQKARKAGVKIAMGSDSGTPFNFHDKSPYELKLMVDAGMTPMEALVSATKTAAELMGIQNTHGTMEPGKRANFLILKDNPLENIVTLMEIETIVKDGTAVKGGFVSESSNNKPRNG